MKALLTACAALALAGCVAIPRKPSPVRLAAKAPIQDSQWGVRDGAAWPDDHWWQRYQDSTLNELVSLGEANSPSLAMTHARFDQAREFVRQTGAAVGARVDMQGSFERQRLSDNGLLPPKLLGFNWYNQADLGLQASYTFDWWGRQRSAVGAAIDAARASEADRAAAAVLLTSSIADTYFGWQLDQARLNLARERVANAERTRRIAALRIEAELDSRDVLSSADAGLAAAREAAAVLEGSAQLRVVALAALVGRAPAELPPLTAKPLPRVDVELPGDLGLDLLSRRADITASRWRVEAASKNVLSARAAFFPDLSIRALAGLSSIDIGRLLEGGSRVPAVSAAVHLPVFDSGALSGAYGANQAELKAAIAGYDDVVVNAAREVAGAAATRQQIASQRTQRLLEIAATQHTEAAATARVREGLSDLRIQLSASQSRIDQQDALLQLDGAALSADIALQRALGGGYSLPPTSTSNLAATTP